MEREGSWWAHSEEPILPLMLLDRGGRRFVCLPCGRAAYFDRSRGNWQHYQGRIWRGHRKGEA